MIRTVSPLMGLAGCLVLLLAIEWLLPEPSSPPWRQPAAIPRPATPTTATDADISTWSNKILGRPLLSQSRRPVPVVSVAVDDTLPRLSAIIVIGGTRTAIFATAGEKPQLVTQGGEIGQYRVRTVAPDRVDMLGPNGPVSVRLQYVGTASAAASPAP